MSQATLHAAVPGPIARKLQMVRTWKMWVHTLNAALLALAVLLAAMSVAMLVDYLAMLYDSRWRYVLTNLALVAAALTCLGWLLVVWRKGMPWARVAGDVDREFPELEERWTTMTRLTPAAVADPNVVHPAMFRRVATEAVRWEPHVDPQEIVSLSPLVKSMLCLTAITLALGIAVILDARQTLVQLRRFWSPGSSISATQLVDVPGNTVVGRGEPLLLTAAIAGRPVDRATLFLESPEEERRIALVAHGSGTAEFSHNVRSVAEPFAYRFRAGDGQTEWYQVAVADRPEIAELKLTITPPEYTRREAKSFSRLPRHLTAIENSEVELAMRPTIAVERVELIGDDKPLATLAADADGWYRWRSTLKETITFAPRLTESHGLANQQAPRCEIVVQADRPPAVKILTPNDQMAVRPDDTIDISFAAQDDVGIGSAELVVYGNEVEDGELVPLTTIPIPLEGQAGARSVQGKVELDMSQFDVHDGVELSYQVRVREDRGQASATSAAAPTAGKQSQSTATTSKQSPIPSAQASSASETNSPTDASPTATTQSSDSEASPSNSQTAQSASPSSSSRSGDAAKERLTPTDGSMSPTPPTSPSALESIARNLQSMSRGTQEGAPSNDTKSANNNAAANSESSETARTAESDRRGLVTSTAQDDATTPDESALADGRQQPGGSPSAASPGGTQPNDSQANNSRQNQSQQNSTQSQSAQPTASNTASSSQSGSPSTPSDPPPGDAMARRGLDVPQQSASQRMRLKVDKWAGSFSGQQRAKAEMAIAPRLAALDEALAKAERTAQGVLDSVQRERQWRPTHDRDVSSAEKSTVRAQELIDELEKESKGTPYAFVGLQVVDVGLAHVDPARDGFWSALESDGAARTGLLADSRQHLVRARQLLAELRGQYERAQREFQLAEAVERVKKMYQVYVENSMALLPTSADDPDRFRRKMHEFDLDDEYLKRLEEVMKMREELRAELAKILADDPRLLRRLMDSIRNRSQNMREELSQLVNDQGVFNREVRAWRETAEADRPRIAQLLLLRQLRKSRNIATSTGELQGRYQAWLPLDRQSKDSNLADATRTIQDLATAANDLQSHAEQFIVETERPKLATPSEESSTDSDATAAAIAPTGPSVDSLLADGQKVYELATRAELTLRQLSASEDDLQIATFAANRLTDTREIIADSSAWVRQVKAHQASKYSRAAEVEQYRLAMKTEELAGKLGSIEQSLAGLMQREDGSLPKPIADKAREFLATLDKEATPNQLASVYALHVDDFAKTTDRQALAQGALEKAERTYDEMIKLAIEEMDKLPVQDPVSNLLDDPTLDELLAQLEQERPIQELLGVPPRPTNLRIVNDWLMGAGNLAMAARSRQWMQQQLQRDNQMSRWQLDQAYRRAIARALKEAKPKQKIARPKAIKLSDWNRLVSELDDDVGQGRDKAPPEQYRRAIEQYFSQISKRVADAEKAQ